MASPKQRRQPSPNPRDSFYIWQMLIDARNEIWDRFDGTRHGKAQGETTLPREQSGGLDDMAFLRILSRFSVFFATGQDIRLSASGAPVLREASFQAQEEPQREQASE